MKILGLEYEQHREFVALSLSGVHFFASLSREQLWKIISFIKLVEFEKGETVFEKDAPGDSFYIIYTGGVEARVPGLFWNKVVNTMGPRDFFGELAFILKQPRTATIICTEPTQCFMLDQSGFALLMEKHLDIALSIRKTASKRYYNYH